MKKFILLQCVVLILATSCSKNSNDEITLPTDEEQKVLFHFSFKNSVRGYENRGQFIDNTGAIIGYTIDSAHHDLVQPKEGYISKSDLLHNFQKAKEPLCTMQLDDMKELYSYFKDIATVTLDEKRPTAYNQGDLYWYGYIWDKDKEQFKQIILHSWGDFTQRNIHEPTAKMYEKLIFAMNNRCL